MTPLVRGNLGRLALPVLTLLYVAMLHVSYVRYVAPTFGYLGMNYRAPIWWEYAGIVVLLCGTAALMPRQVRTPAQVTLWIHFIVATLPAAIIPQLSPVLDPQLAARFGLAVAVAWALILVAVDLVGPRTAAIRTPRLGARLAALVTARWWVAGLLVLSALADVLLLLLPGTHPNLVGFANVTEVRLRYRDALTAVPFFVPYVLLAATNVANPALLAHGLRRLRRWPLVVVGIVGQVLNYAVTGYKTVLLSLLVVIAIALWVRRRSLAGWGLLGGAIAGMVVSLALFEATGFTAAATYFTTRILAVPGNVASATVAYFAGRPPVGWSYSFMSWALDYPYAQAPAFLVGSTFRGTDNVSANVNLFGDGYLNLGYLGIAIECVVLVVLLLGLDRAARGVSPVLAVSVLVVPAFALSNSNVFTAVLTHGFLLAAVVLALAPREAGVPAREAGEPEHGPGEPEPMAGRSEPGPA